MPGGGAEWVVLLHGLGRSRRSMRSIESRLARAGYSVHNLGYASRRHGPEELVAQLVPRIHSLCSGAPRVHFVGHSLGGLLVRACLARQRLPNLGRLVMLAPPNQGSEIADRLGSTALLHWALGPAAGQLGTQPGSFPARLPPPDYEVGVIAGTRGLNPLGAALIPGPSDGTVSIESTRLEGMTDFATVPVPHPLIMRSQRVAELVAAFLATGRFAGAAP